MTKKTEISMILEWHNSGEIKTDEATERICALFSVSNCCSHEWIKSAVQKNAKYCNKCGKYQ